MKGLTVGKGLMLITSLFLSAHCYALSIPVGIVGQVDPVKPIGTIDVIQTKYGLLIKPKLTGLPPGLHGMHIHEAPMCDNFGHAAMGHFDPKKTGKHMGPYNDDGHLGDLPALYVNSDGSANLQVLAPRINLTDLEGHSLMIHLGGDNYSDTPEVNGGGGDRVACGIIPIIPPAEKQMANDIVAKRSGGTTDTTVVKTIETIETMEPNLDDDDFAPPTITPSTSPTPSSGSQVQPDTQKLKSMIENQTKNQYQQLNSQSSDNNAPAKSKTVVTSLPLPSQKDE